MVERDIISLMSPPLRVPIPFMREPPSLSNYFPKIPPLNTFIFQVGLLYINVWGWDTNIQSILVALEGWTVK